MTAFDSNALMMENALKDCDEIAILDFGSQYSHLIARRLRGLKVFCELYAGNAEAKTLIHSGRNLKGIIFSGGPASVYEEDAPHVHESVWELIREKKLPVLGICYGMQEIARVFGGEVSSSDKREFGRANLSLIRDDNVERGTLQSQLFHGVDESIVWMSHGDKVTRVPDTFHALAKSEHCDCAMGSLHHNVFALQFHPEVQHSLCGEQLLSNFALRICGLRGDWTMTNIVDRLIAAIRMQVGEHDHVIGAVSGGVDSTVAAVLLHKAIGSRFHAVLVDNGVLRENEAQKVSDRLRGRLQIDLRTVDASKTFLDALSGVTDPETKRKTIGRLFIEVFQEQAELVQQSLNGEKVSFLLQGTLYPDVIESQSHKGPSATIKSHHNVGGLPAAMKLKLVEPLRELFKDEVRALGEVLGIDYESLYRHPFPGPGLAIRVLGEVTAQRVAVLRKADTILIQELMDAGIYHNIAQAFVVLLPVQSVGVMGDKRTYEQVAAIRCVTSGDFMTADWYRMDYDLLARISTRIINEVRGINRVCYDTSSKPPATIEWE